MPLHINAHRYALESGLSLIFINTPLAGAQSMAECKNPIQPSRRFASSPRPAASPANSVAGHVRCLDHVILGVRRGFKSRPIRMADRSLTTTAVPRHRDHVAQCRLGGSSAAAARSSGVPWPRSVRGETRRTWRPPHRRGRPAGKAAASRSALASDQRVLRAAGVRALALLAARSFASFSR